MNKTYRKSNKKDKFITDHLLGYFINRIENSDSPKDIVDEVASMYIFPYKTENEIELGCLNEPGISWYFDSQKEKKTVSSGSYRILAEDILKPDQAKKLRNTFGEYKYISEFSDNVVIDDLIKKMSYEDDYTDVWWTYAYDVFRLWNQDKFNSALSEATARINNNSFLFLDDYCDNSLKKKLLEHGIFADVLTPTAKRLFWNRIPKGERKKAITVLKNMGVPHSFVIYNDQDIKKTKNQINESLIKFAKEISNTVEFPVGPEHRDYEKCNLCHELFMERIGGESQAAFEDVINSSANSGIVVKNTQGSFVPLSWNLFYSKSELYEDDADEDELDESIDESKYEYLHIDAELYDNSFIEDFGGIHEFADVIETADEYGIDDNDIEFYRWVWKYSHHEELAENILYALSDEDDRLTVDKDYNSFVLSVIEDEKVTDKGYGFDIDMDCQEAFDNAAVINKIFLSFEEIYSVIYGDYTKMDVGEYLERILNATDCSYQEKANIQEDDIWNHVYVANEEENLYAGNYIGGYIYDEDYEKVLILWPSDDIDFYVKALAEYVSNYFSVHVSDELVKSYDWKQEYDNLIHGIKSFISHKTDRKSIDDLYGYIAQMNDVGSFGEEKKIWQTMQMQQKKITEHETGGCPVNFSSWRQFLSAKYKGRCQLCGGKTVTGEQYAHFYTFRVVKESENQLANMTSNLFCLCPSCWGEMGRGDYMGKDLSEIIIKAEQYANCLNMYIKSNQMEDSFDPAVMELLETQDLTEEEEEKLEGFVKPIVCRVVVNGKDRCMAFSWEHFIRLAYILSEANKQT
ncbi:hypothetical protein SAMN04487770_12847 [Butyrivibrio sp. ob235]|uniref:hypothetical protein n=1 Tax=Butyrivibrio sp. ob235 TaxID=1761780 RepID=UPI0008AA80DF|nr:hypothetical protein [Butyrivibrio sp. ob235]SEM19654.1 hypothetical protein SAMN04487770_12847 [Butyrivibrio sp. ob235]